MSKLCAGTGAATLVHSRSQGGDGKSHQQYCSLAVEGHGGDKQCHTAENSVPPDSQVQGLRLGLWKARVGGIPQGWLGGAGGVTQDRLTMGQACSPALLGGGTLSEPCPWQVGMSGWHLGHRSGRGQAGRMAQRQ